MMNAAIARFMLANDPILATAIHAGSFMRPSLLPYCGLSEAERLREEDPYTDHIAKVSPAMIVADRSRFEVDLNRPKEKSVYLRPEDAWGLKVWHDLPQEEADASYALHEAFYQETGRMMDELLRKQEHVVIFDVHSYNHQREGEGIFADPASDPDINIGTANLDGAKWNDLVREVMREMRRPLPDGTSFDVRENVKFKGGYFTKWLHQRYGERVCPLAIEFKKIFMNEWTGAADMQALERSREVLGRAATIIRNIYRKG